MGYGFGPDGGTRRCFLSRYFGRSRLELEGPFALPCSIPEYDSGEPISLDEERIERALETGPSPVPGN